MGRYSDSIYLLPPHMQSLPSISIPHQSGTFVTSDECRFIPVRFFKEPGTHREGGSTYPPFVPPAQRDLMHIKHRTRSLEHIISLQLINLVKVCSQLVFTNLNISWAARGKLPTWLQSGLLCIKDVGKHTDNETLNNSWMA